MAKFSMVLMAGLGNSAAMGSNSPFMDSMKDKKRLLGSWYYYNYSIYHYR